MKRAGLSVGYRLSVLSRVVAAVAGGYALATVASLLLVRLLDEPRAEAVLTGMLSSFAIYCGAVIWVFSVRTAWHAWAGLLVTTLVIGAVWWWLGAAP